MESNEITTKQDISWHIVDILLSEIKRYGAYKTDEEFQKLFAPLYGYVANKLALPTDDEVVETCVLVVQRPANT